MILDDGRMQGLPVLHSHDPDVLIIGLGYVGLPLAAEAIRCGLAVVGYDLDETVVSGLNAGRSHIGDVPSAGSTASTSLTRSSSASRPHSPRTTAPIWPR